MEQVTDLFYKMSLFNEAKQVLTSSDCGLRFRAYPSVFLCIYFAKFWTVLASPIVVFAFPICKSLSAYPQWKMLAKGNLSGGHLGQQEM